MEMVLNFAGGCFGIMILYGVFKLLENRQNHKFYFSKAKREEAEKKKAEAKAECKAQEEKREAELKEILETLHGLQHAMRTSMQDRIKHLARRYIEKGEVSYEDWKDLKDMYDDYKNPKILNGNGKVDKVMTDFFKIKVIY